MKDEIKSKITCAAVEEFLCRGYEAVSMEGVAKLAAISKRTLYRYFPNKDELFESLVDRLILNSCMTPLQNYDDKHAFEDQLKAFIDAKVTALTHVDYIKSSRIVLGELIRGRKVKTRHEKIIQEEEAKAIGWIFEARKAGKIQSPYSDEFILNHLHSLIKSQIFYPVIFGFKTLAEPDIQLCKSSTFDLFVKSFCFQNIKDRDRT